MAKAKVNDDVDVDVATLSDVIVVAVVVEACRTYSSTF